MDFGSAPPETEDTQADDSTLLSQASQQTHIPPGSSASGLPSQVKNNLLGQSAPPSTSLGGQGQKAHGNEQLYQAKQLLSPLGLIRTATEQFLGEPTQEEKQRRQSEIMQSQQRMAQERQQLESFRQSQTMQRQQQGQTNAALAEQASTFTNKPVTHIGSSKAEQTLLEKIITDGQQNASQANRSSLPSSPQKGPNMGNSQPKADMMARMQPDKQKAKKAEPAAHELPLGE